MYFLSPPRQLCFVFLDIEQPMIKTLNDSKLVIGQKISLLCKSRTSSQETPTYAWYKDGVLLSGENATNVLELNNITESDSGVYTCAAKNNIGSKTSASFELKVHGNILLNFYTMHTIQITIYVESPIRNTICCIPY